jgi:hypothetical protein
VACFSGGPKTKTGRVLMLTQAQGSRLLLEMSLANSGRRGSNSALPAFLTRRFRFAVGMGVSKMMKARHSSYADSHCMPRGSVRSVSTCIDGSKLSSVQEAVLPERSKEALFAGQQTTSSTPRRAEVNKKN